MSKIKKKSGIGKLFLGIFLGFLLGLGAVVGVGFFAYHNLSAKWLNDKFNANVDLGSNEMNKMTIKDFVSTAVNVGSNIDTYSFVNLKSDFGIDLIDELENATGMEFDDVANKPISKIADTLKDKFATISADELSSIMDLSNMNKILNKSNQYYLKNRYTLYKDALFTNEVDFDYEVANSKVIIKGKEYIQDQNGKIEVGLKYLPLTNAISDFTDTLGDKITLNELKSDYGVNLPVYFDSIDGNTTINQLGGMIDSLTLADFLDYSYDVAKDTFYEDKNNNKVLDEGEELGSVINLVAGSKISEITSTINNLTVAKLFNYTIVGSDVYQDKNGNNVKDAGEEVTGILKAIANENISTLSTRVEGLKLEDVFGNDEFNSGALLLLKNSKGTPINQLSSTLDNVLQNITIQEMYESKLITLTPEQINKLNKPVAAEPTITVGEMKVSDIISAYINGLSL